jgi:hypothetical protein
LGLIVFFGKDSEANQYGLELLHLYGIMSLIAIASNAIQLTPFAPIDTQIMNFESHFHINIPSILEWTHTHSLVKKILSAAYDSLPYQMSILPLCVIMSGRFHLLREYYFLMLLTTLLGYTFYYFFPTTAPASVISSALFGPEQLATGLKFTQIHSHILPTTNQGGLIALPSFHVIWALLCIYLVKDWYYIRTGFVIINSALILSCILLGWHYPTDVIAGLFIVGFSYCCLNYCKNGKKYRMPLLKHY